jgi:hypothetical protein
LKEEKSNIRKPKTSKIKEEKIGEDEIYKD